MLTVNDFGRIHGAHAGSGKQTMIRVSGDGYDGSVFSADPSLNHRDDWI